MDENEGILQLPAIGAYGEPVTVRLQDVRALQCKTLLRPEQSEDNRGMYRLNLLSTEQYSSRTLGVPFEGSIEHTVAQGGSRAELEALADWLNGATEFNWEIEEAVSDGSVATLVKELNQSSPQS